MRTPTIELHQVGELDEVDLKVRALHGGEFRLNLREVDDAPSVGLLHLLHQIDEGAHLLALQVQDETVLRKEASNDYESPTIATLTEEQHERKDENEQEGRRANHHRLLPTRQIPPSFSLLLTLLLSLHFSSSSSFHLLYLYASKQNSKATARSLLIALSLLLTTDRFSLLQLLGRILRHQLFLLWSALRFCLLGRGLSCLLGCSPLPLPLHFFLRVIRTDQVNSLLLLLLLQLHVSFSHLLLKIIPRHKKHIESLLYLS